MLPERGKALRPQTGTQVFTPPQTSHRVYHSAQPPRNTRASGGGGGGGGRSPETSERSAAQHLAESTDNVNTIGRVRELGDWREDETAEQELEGVPSPVGCLCLPFPSLAGDLSRLSHANLRGRMSLSQTRGGVQNSRDDVTSSAHNERFCPNITRELIGGRLTVPSVHHRHQASTKCSLFPFSASVSQRVSVADDAVDLFHETSRLPTPTPRLQSHVRN